MLSLSQGEAFNKTIQRPSSAAFENIIEQNNFGFKIESFKFMHFYNF